MARVLVVEQHDLQRTRLRALLAEHSDHDVRAAATAEAALAALLSEDRRPQVVVLDCGPRGEQDAAYLLALAHGRALPPCTFVLLADDGVRVRAPQALRARCVVLRASPLRLPHRPHLLLAAVAEAARRLPSEAFLAS